VCNSVDCISKVTLNPVTVVIGDLRRDYNPEIHLGPLSLLIPLWIGETSTVLAMVSAAAGEETASPA